MPERSSKKLDDAQNALRIVEQAIGESLAEKRKNPAAVALGRKGDLKGGRARAETLSEEERSAIASHAARARWNKKKRT